ncbi:uncharacterized protein [Nicotiana sylvestris]|uniref:uncharacterized protein n=1 Tax=Nicotiana sylvestris TaxID=4096 RepID=UPI00388C3C5B
MILRENALLDEIKVGSILDKKKSIINCFSNIAIKGHFEFKVVRSSSRRYSLKCNDDRCGWCVCAFRIKDSTLFKIVKIEKNHDCSVNTMKANQRHATSKLISGYIIDNLRDPRFEVTLAFVMVEMQKLHGLDIGYHKAWCAIQLASALIRGTPEENYELLSSYLYMMRSKNPGTYTNIKIDDNNRFLYMFYAYRSSISGWNHCRPVIAIDATSRENLIFLSDKHQAIAYGIAKVYLESHHGICIYQLKQNLKRRKVKSEVIKLFQSAARVYRCKEFDLYMSDISKVDKKTYDYLMEEPPERSKEEELKKKRDLTFTLNVFHVDSWRSRVEEEGITFLVDLNKRTCDCFQFQFDELSCIHAIASIEKRNIKKSNFCSHGYLKESWLKTYERQIHPVGHTNSWIVPESVKSQIVKPLDFKVTESSKITCKCGRC